MRTEVEFALPKESIVYIDGLPVSLVDTTRVHFYWNKHDGNYLELYNENNNTCKPASDKK